MGLKERLENQADAITSVAEHDIEQLEQLMGTCEATLRAKKQIVVSALGKNVPICEKFAGTLNSFGLKCRFMHTNSAIHGDLGILEPEDLLIIVSKSGSTEESLRLAKEAKRKPITTWALTCRGNSPLTKLTTRATSVRLTHEGDLWNLTPLNSSIVFLAAFNAIAVELASRLSCTRDAFLENHPGGAIGRKGKRIGKPK